MTATPSPAPWERKGDCNHCGYCCAYEGPVLIEQRARPDKP